MGALRTSRAAGGRETCTVRTERETDPVHTGFWFWSYLGPFFTWQEQVGSALVRVRSGSGSVPQKLDLDLTDQTGLQTELLHFKIKV